MNEDDITIEPGMGSMRSHLRIVEDDARVFHPYKADEVAACAKIISSDESLPPVVTRLLVAGLVADMCMPCGGENLHSRCGLSRKQWNSKLIMWESVDADLRFMLVRRCVRMLVAFRATK